MWTIAFYLAIATFFIPRSQEKIKKIVGFTSMGITGVFFLLLIISTFCYGFYSFLDFFYSTPLFFIELIYQLLSSLFMEIDMTYILIKILEIFTVLIFSGIQIALAFVAIKFDLQKIKDKNKLIK